MFGCDPPAPYLLLETSRAIGPALLRDAVALMQVQFGLSSQLSRGDTGLVRLDHIPVRVREI